MEKEKIISRLSSADALLSALTYHLKEAAPVVLEYRHISRGIACPRTILQEIERVRALLVEVMESD